MFDTFKYFKSIFTHKWYVLLAGLKVGRIPIWRLVIHDWAKFTPSEIDAYRSRIVNGGEIVDREKWGRAWHHHYMRSPHHWEHWKFDWQGKHDFYDNIVIDGCLEMPETYAREMVADWMGASRIYTGSWDMTEWLRDNLEGMRLRPKTREKVHSILSGLGYRPIALYTGGRVSFV